MSVARNAAAPVARRAVSRRPGAKVAMKRPVVPANQVMLLDGDWELYRKLDAELSGTGVSVTYLDGVIEVMSLSPLHELIKINIGDLVAHYMLHRKLFYGRQGGPTRKLKKQVAAEPDDSFVFERGRILPQLVIEVALTSGGLDKLQVWACWPIEEVWIWKKGKLHFYRWEDDGYVEQKESTLVPGFRREWAERFAECRESSDMIQEFRALL